MNDIYSQGTNTCGKKDLGLWGKKWNDKSQGPSLFPSPSRNRPGFVCWHRDPDEVGTAFETRPTNVRMPIMDWEIWKIQAELFLKGKIETFSIGIETKEDWNDPSSGNIEVCKMGLKKNDKDEIMLVILAKDRKPCEFVFKNSFLSNFYANGNKVSDGVISRLAAKAWINSVGETISYDIGAGHRDEAELKKAMERKSEQSSDYDDDVLM